MSDFPLLPDLMEPLDDLDCLDFLLVADFERDLPREGFSGFSAIHFY